jgi:hypothetical protein
MSSFRSRRAPRSGLVKIERMQPIAFHASPGSAVYAIDGLLWLTQEGLIDDVVLAPGGRFDVRQTGLIVVSGVEEPALAYVAKAKRADRGRSVAITSERFHAAEREARELRRRELARTVRRTREFFVRLGVIARDLWREKRWAVAPSRAWRS